MMRAFSSLPLVIALVVGSSPAAAQRVLAKSIDSTHRAVVTVRREDAESRIYSSSGVPIHPRVVLTAGHVTKVVPGMPTSASVVWSGDARRADRVHEVDVRTAAERHPEVERFDESLGDTSGRLRPTMFRDLALLFLPEPIPDAAVVRLPDASPAWDADASNLLGVAHGYHQMWDSTITPELLDGRRRSWKVADVSVVERYLLAGCDPQSGSPSMGAGDSGGALLRGDSVIVGVWSFIDPDRATPPCPYASLAVRLDEPEVQAWIRSAVKKRLGVDRP